jgi:hypothetical protein
VLDLLHTYFEITSDDDARTRRENRPRAQACTWHRCSKRRSKIVSGCRAFTLISSAQFFEQCFGVFQVGGVEAFGEPAVDLKEHCARFLATPPLDEHLREIQHRA